MFRFMSKQEAAALIPDGAVVAVNSFLSICNPQALHEGIYERFTACGHPRDLTLLCASGYGNRDEVTYAEPYVKAGAVRRVIASHYATMPVTQRLALDNQIEAYCLPLSAISHGIRAAAGGQKGCLSQVGLRLFVDPRVQGPGVNARSREKLVDLVELDGEEYLYYRVPPVDVALIKATSVDAAGNISFEDEYVVVDALSLAQSTRAHGGLVLVQVDRVTHLRARPRNVVIPGILVDGVVVAEPSGKAEPTQTLSGDIHVPTTHMDYWMRRLQTAYPAKVKTAGDESREIIGARAAAELKPGDIVNIGVGIPEQVAAFASRRGILKDITLTVEAGGVGGLPAPGGFFGASIGADMITDMAAQFDFYNGGGLSICFMGALEVDRFGNVNAHALPDSYPGIGGFANITGATKNVVFCLNFRARGLLAKNCDGRVCIERDGSLPKFKRDIYAVSFSAQRALENGHRVLYVTERCVFQLVPGGLKLVEVYPGVDPKNQIAALLDFPLIP